MLSQLTPSVAWHHTHPRRKIRSKLSCKPELRAVILLDYYLSNPDCKPETSGLSTRNFWVPRSYFGRKPQFRTNLDSVVVVKEFWCRSVTNARFFERINRIAHSFGSFVWGSTQPSRFPLRIHTTIHQRRSLSKSLRASTLAPLSPFLSQRLLWEPRGSARGNESRPTTKLCL